MTSIIPTALRSTAKIACVRPVNLARAPSLPPIFPFIRQASSSSSAFGLRAPAPEAHPLSYKDGAIPYRTVQLVDPSTNHLLEPQSLRSILSTYDQSTHSLVLVNVDKEIPIVKLINKLEERKKERDSEEKAKLKKKMSMEEKEVQISWQSAQGDLHHKLQLAKSLLEKGDRVQIVFANRKRGDSIPENKKMEIISMFHEELEGVVGKRWKDDDKQRGLWVMFYNPLEVTRNQVQNKVKEQETNKKMEKYQKKEERRRKEEERRAKAEAEVGGGEGKGGII